MLHDLSAMQSRGVSTEDGLRKGAPVWSDASTIYFVGAGTSEMRKTDLYALNISGGAPQPLTADDSVKTDPIVATGGRFVVFTAGGTNPLGGRGGAGGRGGG